MSEDENLQSNNQKRRKLYNVDHYEKLAQKLFDPTARLYFNCVNERGLCYQDSVGAFSRYRIRSRILQDVSELSLSTTVLGEHIPYPIGIAPTGMHVMAHPDAERATAKGAAVARALMIQPVASNCSIAEVAGSAPGALRWIQIYVFRDRLFTQHIVREAERAGYKAIVVTVDSPYTGISPEMLDVLLAGSLSSQPKYCLKNFEADVPTFWDSRAYDDCNHFNSLYNMHSNRSASWADIKWIKSVTSLPIVCKGILTAEAARCAAEAGVDGIMVSAHGGRQSDGSPAPIDALAEVVEAVRGRGIEVYMDGGVRTGTDIFKALGRGARAVFVGRPIIWGLACEGGEGVTNVLEILKQELETALTIGGCRSPHDIPPGTIVHESYYHNNTSKSKL